MADEKFEVTEKAIVEELNYLLKEEIEVLLSSSENLINPVFKKTVKQLGEILKNMHIVIQKSVNPEGFQEFFRNVKERLELKASEDQPKDTSSE